MYDLSEKWNDPASVEWTDGGAHPREVVDPLFTLGSKGDTRVSFHEIQFPDNAYLNDATLAAAGEWGADMDVRRVTPVSGATAGVDWWGGKAIRNFHPLADESIPATPTEKTWIFAVYGGLGCGNNLGTCVTMVRVKFYIAGDALKVKLLGARRNVGVTNAERAALNDYIDVMNPPTPIGELYNNAPWTLDIAYSAHSGAIGLGGFKYVIAPEMVPSLANINIVGIPASLGVARGENNGVAAEPNPKLGQDAASAGAAIPDYPHYFGHKYPGTEGCEATCEGDTVDESKCGSMFYCEWYKDKCWSKVGTEPCPATEEELAGMLQSVLDPKDGSAHQAGACSIQCEHDDQAHCAGDPLCTWSGNQCFSKYDEPCPV